MTHAYANERALVLGASGFIGRWVALKLQEAGAKLFLVVRDSKGAARLFDQCGIKGEILESDLCRPGAPAEILRGMRPAITFNLAGYGVDPSERDENLSEKINAALPGELCHAAAQYRDRPWSGQCVVNAGSALEYGEIGGNLDEDGPVKPSTTYGKAKLAGTEAVARVCRERQVRGLTARLFTVYGPGEHAGRLLPSLIYAARSGARLDLTAGMQKRDFTYVEDAAEGLLRLGVSQAEPGIVVNLATGKLTCVREFVEIAARVIGIPQENLRFGEIPTRVEEMSHEPVTVERLKRTTGFVPPTGIEEGIRRTLENTRKGRVEGSDFGAAPEHGISGATT
jgi:nucleoside-diphosphate-sugar epimerase